MVNEEVDLLVTDSEGRRTGEYNHNGNTQVFNEIPGAIYTHQNPINNPNTNDESESLGGGINEFLLPEPQTGDYEIKISSNNNEIYTLNIASFEEDGDQTVDQILGAIGPNTQDTFMLDYSKADPPENSNIVTFDSLIADINTLHALSEIKNITHKILLIQANISKGLSFINKRASGRLLRMMFREIERQRGKGITETAYRILNNDIAILISQLST